jgi:hypothetical protein
VVVRCDEQGFDDADGLTLRPLGEVAEAVAQVLIRLDLLDRKCVRDGRSGRSVPPEARACSAISCYVGGYPAARVTVNTSSRHRLRRSDRHFLRSTRACLWCGGMACAAATPTCRRLVSVNRSPRRRRAARGAEHRRAKSLRPGAIVGSRLTPAGTPGCRGRSKKSTLVADVVRS